jgi:hypothetical protein
MADLLQRAQRIEQHRNGVVHSVWLRSTPEPTDSGLQSLRIQVKKNGVTLTIGARETSDLSNLVPMLYDLLNDFIAFYQFNQKTNACSLPPDFEF